MDETTTSEHILTLCPNAQHTEDEGNTYFFSGENRQRPFATLVTTDEHDTVSGLGREGVYRLNIGVNLDSYTQLFGSLPDDPVDGSVIETEYDYQQLDRLMPHPIYSPLAWVCILNPIEETFKSLDPLIVEAFEKAPS